MDPDSKEQLIEVLDRLLGDKTTVSMYGCCIYKTYYKPLQEK